MKENMYLSLFAVAEQLFEIETNSTSEDSLLEKLRESYQRDLKVNKKKKKEQ